MSHVATHWLAEIDPESISNAEFRVLFVLCDCHNPSRGCFPSQKYLMEKTGRGNSSVNDALSRLEAKRIILRERRHNSKTKQREATNYILGFELNVPQDAETDPESGAGTDVEQKEKPTPHSGDGAISGFQAKPSPVFGQSHLLKTGVVYKDEPVKEPVIEPCVADAPHNDFSEFFDKYPRAGDRELTRAAYDQAIAQGETHKRLMFALSSYCADNSENIKHRKFQYLKSSNLWLAARYFDRYPMPDSNSDNFICGVSPLTVQAIRDGRGYLCSQISSTVARALVDGGHVTPVQCKASGVRL